MDGRFSSFLTVVSLLVEETKHRQVAKCEARGPGHCSLYQNSGRRTFRVPDERWGSDGWCGEVA